MIYKLADNITSPLGDTTADNLEAVRQYRTALSLHQLWDMPEPFMGSLFAEGRFAHKDFKTAVIASVSEALSQLTWLDVASPRVGLVLSSTKGDTTGPDGETFAESARNIAHAVGLTTEPVTVSNACISGLSAQIDAMRMLESGMFDTVIVAGCDIQSKFIVSGFQSFKALSKDECRPFDEDRNGLNLGEAAATIVYGIDKPSDAKVWAMTKGAIRNDAFHISGPSRTAEGSYRALRLVTEGEDIDSLACINAHGTATLYNDDMESNAIHRAGLTSVTVNSLKGYYGHTMGAAGLLETIVMMHAVAEGWIPGTRNYNASGTCYELKMSGSHIATDKKIFVKLMSGFGGCNAAALYKIIEQ